MYRFPVPVLCSTYLYIENANSPTAATKYQLDKELNVNPIAMMIERLPTIIHFFGLRFLGMFTLIFPPSSMIFCILDICFSTRCLMILDCLFRLLKDVSTSSRFPLDVNPTKPSISSKVVVRKYRQGNLVA